MQKFGEVLPSFTQGVTLNVLKLLDEGLYAEQIARKLGKSSKTVHEHIQKLKVMGFIEEKTRDVYKIYEVTEKGKAILKQKVLPQPSVGISTKLRLHAMRAKMRILEDKELPKEFWDKAITDFTNWIPKYKRIPTPIGITICKTPKSVVINIHSREIDDPREAQNIAWRTCLYVQHLLLKQGLVLDLWSAEITNQHYAIPDKMAEEIVKKGVYVEVYLGRNVQSILLGDKPAEAKAWIDQSKGFPEIESNDLEYATRLIKMPDMVSEIYKMQGIYAENIKLHMEWVKKGIEVMTRLEDVIKEREGVKMADELVEKRKEKGAQLDVAGKKAMGKAKKGMALQWIGDDKPVQVNLFGERVYV